MTKRSVELTCFCVTYSVFYVSRYLTNVVVGKCGYNPCQIFFIQPLLFLAIEFVGGIETANKMTLI